MTANDEADAATLRDQFMEWKQGIRSELSFWEEWMQERGGQWQEGFEKRFNPETPLIPLVAVAARNLGKQKVSILDVGLRSSALHQIQARRRGAADYGG